MSHYNHDPTDRVVQSHDKPQGISCSSIEHTLNFVLWDFQCSRPLCSGWLYSVDSRVIIEAVS